MLTTFKKYKGKKNRNAKTFTSFEERWYNDKYWKRMFGDIVSSLIRRVVGLRDEDINELCDTFAKLFGIHLDHQLKYFNKKDPCSQLQQTSIFNFVVEAIKCRVVTGFKHEQGNIPGYQNKLKQKLVLRYNLGTEHKSAKDVLKMKEMKCFILELKSRGFYSQAKESKAHWEALWNTLEFLVWKYFRILLVDLVYWTKKEYVAAAPKMRGCRIPNTVIMNLLKKFGVKCPGCGCDFMNLIPAHMSGIHMNHRKKKIIDPSEAVGKHPDVFIKEMKEGDCDPLCCFDHGEYTAWENGCIGKAAWM